MSYSLSPLMQLPLPAIGPGGEPGPAWAMDLNNALGYIDQHNHDQTAGPAGHAGAALNQNCFVFTGALNMNGYGPKNVGSVAFSPQAAPLAPSVTQTLYTSGNDLYFNDGAGNAVRLTASGAVNTGASGTIGGMDGSAAVTYATGSKTFTFTQSSTDPAALAIGNLFLYQQTAGVTNAVELSSPAGLASAYQLTLPPALPAAPALVQCTTGGALGFVTTLPSGLTAPGMVLADFAGAGVMATPAGGHAGLAALATDGFGVSQSAAYFLNAAGTRWEFGGGAAKNVAGVGLDLAASYVSATGTTGNTLVSNGGVKAATIKANSLNALGRAIRVRVFASGVTNATVFITLSGLVVPFVNVVSVSNTFLVADFTIAYLTSTSVHVFGYYTNVASFGYIEQLDVSCSALTSDQQVIVGGGGTYNVTVYAILVEQIG